MIKIFKISLILVLILILFHLKQFLIKKNKYEILQINNKINNYNSHLNEHLPLILKDHTIDVIKNKLSPLTITKKTLTNYDSENKYFTHSKDTLFLYTDKQIKLTISSPNQKNRFEYIQYKNPFKLYKNKNNDFSSISIILRPNNLILIPRFWYVNIDNNEPFSIFYSDTIFSFLFKLIL